MQFQCIAENPGDAAIAQYVATVINLQDRLCVEASKVKAFELELDKAKARIAELEKPKDAPKLAAAPELKVGEPAIPCATESS